MKIEKKMQILKVKLKYKKKSRSFSHRARMNFILILLKYINYGMKYSKQEGFHLIEY